MCGQISALRCRQVFQHALVNQQQANVRAGTCIAGVAGQRPRSSAVRLNLQAKLWLSQAHNRQFKVAEQQWPQANLELSSARFEQIRLAGPRRIGKLNALGSNGCDPAQLHI